MTTLSREDQFEAMKEGIREAFAEAIAADDPKWPQFILDEIREGVRLAFDQVWGSNILDAIADGTREALERKR